MSFRGRIWHFLSLAALAHPLLARESCLSRITLTVKIEVDSAVPNPQEWEAFFERSAIRTAAIMPDGFVDPDNLTIRVANTEDPTRVLQSTTEHGTQTVIVGTHKIRCETTEACSFTVHEVSHNYFALNMDKAFAADPRVVEIEEKIVKPMEARLEAASEAANQKREELMAYQKTLPPLPPRRQMDPPHVGRTEEERKLMQEYEDAREQYRVEQSKLAFYRSGPSPGREGIYSFWNRDEFLAYNELFADLGAVLDADDPRVIDTHLKALGHEKDSQVRSFVGTPVQGNWSPYAILDGAKKFLGNTYLQKPLSVRQKKLLLEAVFDAAKDEMVRAYIEGPNSGYFLNYNRAREAYDMPALGTEGLSNRLIDGIRQRLGPDF